MTEIILEGNWSEGETQRVADALRKALGTGDGGGAEATVETSILGFPDLLSRRQRKLYELMKQGTTAAIASADAGEPCDLVRRDWGVYDEAPLAKALVDGAVRVSDGVTYRLNDARRWERVEGESQYIDRPVNMAAFDLPITDGEFGRGVYLPVLEAPAGGLRLRVHLGLIADELITAEEFYEVEDDLAGSTELLLNAKNIKAIATTDGEQVTQIFVRDQGEITPLGVVADGPAPAGGDSYRLVSLFQQAGGMIADLEVVKPGQALSKAARKSNRRTMQSTTHLAGTPLVRTSAPDLDRLLVRKAIARCRADGVNFDGLAVRLVTGVPEFLPKMTHAYCLPQDRAICLCPHDPVTAVHGLVQQVSDRLQTAVLVGAADPGEALAVLTKAAKITPEWWLEMLLKRYVGAIRCSPSEEYINLLAGRGWSHWGNARSLAECISEDYRAAHDPAGLPNLVTLEWDLALPAHARACQQILMRLANDA